MRDFNFYTPTKIYFGKGKEALVGEIIKEYGFKKIMLQYGMGSIKKCGLYDTVMTSLKENGIEVVEAGGVEPNQFAADGYDCVYAIYGALKELAAEGKEITPQTSASDMCEMLKAKFTGGYTLAEGATGTNIKWNADGTVAKGAVKYNLK